MVVLLLEDLSAVCKYVSSVLGEEIESMEASEITGGNMNYAWRVSLPSSSSSSQQQQQHSVFVKQAPDYIKCLGEDFGLTSQRMHREVEALRAMADISEKHVPRVLHFDAERCVAILEDLAGFELLSRELMEGRVDASIAADLGKFLRLAADSTFSDNDEMKQITTEYVFTKPFVEDATNRHLEGAVGLRATALRRDAEFLAAVKRARDLFVERKECLCHGDLHSGSVMTDGQRTCVIDAEFAFFGPKAFDLALLTAAYIFEYCSAEASCSSLDRASVTRLKCKEAIEALYGEKGYGSTDQLQDALLFASCELMRRVLGAASVPFLSELSESRRAHVELLVLQIGATLVQQPPDNLHTLLSILDDCYDAHNFATGGSS